MAITSGLCKAFGHCGWGACVGRQKVTGEENEEVAARERERPSRKGRRHHHPPSPSPTCHFGIYDCSGTAKFLLVMLRFAIQRRFLSQGLDCNPRA